MVEVDGGICPKRRHSRVAILLFLSVVINYLDRSNLSIVAGQISDNLHLEPKQLGVALSAFGWTYAILQVPASRLVDKIAPRHLLAGTLFAWSFATFLNGFVASFINLLVLRMLIGALEAPSYSINNRVVTSWFPESNRAGVIGLYTSGQFVGLAFLTPALAQLEGRYGWRAVFYFTGGLGIVWSLVWWCFYRDPAIERHTSYDTRSTNKDRSRSSSLKTDLAKVLGNRQLWGIYLGQFGLSSTLWFFLTWFPTYLTRFRHIQLEKAGLLAAAPFLSAFAGVLLSGLISDFLLRCGRSLTFSRKMPIVIGLLLASTIGLVNWFSDVHYVVFLMSVSFFGCGFASITWSLVSTLSPTGLIGLTGGFFNFFSNCAAIVVPIVVGLLIHGQDFAIPLIFISAMAILGILSYVLLVGQLPQPSKESF